MTPEKINSILREKVQIPNFRATSLLTLLKFIDWDKFLTAYSHDPVSAIITDVVETSIKLLDESDRNFDLSWRVLRDVLQNVEQIRTVAAKAEKREIGKDAALYEIETLLRKISSETAFFKEAENDGK